MNKLLAQLQNFLGVTDRQAQVAIPLFILVVVLIMILAILVLGTYHL
jgi:hypothetical protein